MRVKIILLPFLALVCLGVLILAGYKAVCEDGKCRGISEPQSTENGGGYCVKVETGEKMSLAEAKEIANNSDCVQQGSLRGEYFCNENTGTWWFDLDIQKEGCSPACVINLSTKKAEINWRCTGLLPY
jgi:hypothetical protein